MVAWTGQRRLPWYAAFTQFPVFRQCTLADYVMPNFMLIIGLAIPYSLASAKAKNIPSRLIWLRTIKRAALLVLLGWILCYFRDQFAPWLYSNPRKPFTVNFGMDVLQLLGVGYLVARILYQLPAKPRLAAALALFLWHWSLLRFYPQGNLPAGTFTEEHNAVGYAYAHWPIWDMLTLHLGPLTIGWRGLLSVPPAAATMLLGTLAGDWMRRKDISDSTRLRRLAGAGALAAVVGLAWAFVLPFNKPRWTPCYLLYVAGVGMILISLLYYAIDMKQSRWWTRPFIVFGVNPLAVYFLSIMAKVLLLNTPRITLADGSKTSLNSSLVMQFKHALGGWTGGWAFTLLFISFWWIVMDQLYRRKIFWKI